MLKTDAHYSLNNPSINIPRSWNPILQRKTAYAICLPGGSGVVSVESIGWVVDHDNINHISDRNSEHVLAGRWVERLRLAVKIHLAGPGIGFCGGIRYVSGFWYTLSSQWDYGLGVLGVTLRLHWILETHFFYFFITSPCADKSERKQLF